MTEDHARDWMSRRHPQRAEAIARFVDCLIAETARHNLIAASTVETIWSRHIVDSAQLLDHAPDGWIYWVDIGSGAGLPGLVIAILTDRYVTLIEPRRLRAEFLRTCAGELGLSRVTVVHSKAETAQLPAYADIVSARAVASIDKILVASRPFASPSTMFILPKGATADADIANARRSWHGRFHVEQSIVDPHSGIVIASEVQSR